MHALRALLPLAAFASCAALATPARATFSVVAVDTATGAIGSAGASCVPYEVIRILRVAPGKGLLVGQAYFDDDALAQGEAMLAAGDAPALVLASVTDSAAHPDAPRMQYGIVDITGRTASFTGPEAKSYAADLSGTTGTFAFTVQGNLLTGPEVLDNMKAAMTDGCDLADRLVRALEAAGTNAGGDARCTEDGLSAASAYVLVDQGGVTTLRISLPDLRPQDPITALRAELDTWRADHPCPSPDPDPDSTSASGGSSLSPPAASACAQSPSPPTAPFAPFAALTLALALATLRARPLLRTPRPVAVPSPKPRAASSP